MADSIANTAEQKKARKPRRTEVGVVTSAKKTPKTLRVEVQYQMKHPIYGKFMRRSRLLHVHDPNEEANEGDRVQVMECRRISKTKNWRLIRILEKAPQD